MSYTDVTAGVTLLGEFTSEEFVEFRAEYTVGDELALFADLGGHSCGLSEELWVEKSVRISRYHPKHRGAIHPSRQQVVSNTSLARDMDMECHHGRTRRRHKP